MLLRTIRLFLISFYWSLPLKHQEVQLPSISIERELTRRKRKLRRVKQRPKPRDFALAAIHRTKARALARDRRYSNQRTLRRMYKNL